MMYYLWLNEWKWTDGECAVMGAPGSRANILFLTIYRSIKCDYFFFFFSTRVLPDSAVLWAPSDQQEHG